VSVFEVGTELDEVEVTADLGTSVRYAGASGDFNELHYDQAFAAEASPTGGPIAHGMYALGIASRQLTAFAGGPAAVEELTVRFPRPWPLGTSARFTGRVIEVDDQGATVDLMVTGEAGGRILKGRARIRH